MCYNCIGYTYLPTPPLRQDMTRGQFFKRRLTGLNSEFSFSPRLKNLVYPTILPIAGGRIIGFIPFPRVLVLCEMQSVLSRIWTCVTVSIFYDDNHYTTDIISDKMVRNRAWNHKVGVKIVLCPVYHFNIFKHNWRDLKHSKIMCGNICYELF